MRYSQRVVKGLDKHKKVRTFVENLNDMTYEQYIEHQELLNEWEIEREEYAEYLTQCLADHFIALFV